MQLHKKSTGKNAGKTGVSLRKYAGTLTLKEDPLTIQKKMSNDWA